jgi:hypothetical protein
VLARSEAEKPGALKSECDGVGPVPTTNAICRVALAAPVIGYTASIGLLSAVIDSKAPMRQRQIALRLYVALHKDGVKALRALVPICEGIGWTWFDVASALRRNGGLGRNENDVLEAATKEMIAGVYSREDDSAAQYRAMRLALVRNMDVESLIGNWIASEPKESGHRLALLKKRIEWMQADIEMEKTRNNLRDNGKKDGDVARLCAIAENVGLYLKPGSRPAAKQEAQFRNGPRAGGQPQAKGPVKVQ